jgi:hypothetical protein
MACIGRSWLLCAVRAKGNFAAPLYTYTLLPLPACLPLFSFTVCVLRP